VNSTGRFAEHAYVCVSGSGACGIGYRPWHAIKLVVAAMRSLRCT
jgi:hypothetical protein